jgi:hypothetical protein
MNESSCFSKKKTVSSRCWKDHPIYKIGKEWVLCPLQRPPHRARQNAATPMTRAFSGKTTPFSLRYIIFSQPSRTPLPPPPSFPRTTAPCIASSVPAHGEQRLFLPVRALESERAEYGGATLHRLGFLAAKVGGPGDPRRSPPARSGSSVELGGPRPAVALHRTTPASTLT